VRVVLLLAILVVVIVLVLPLLRRRTLAPAASRGAPAAPAGRDELVKDPVCQTYVVRSRAVQALGPGGPRHFCSAECARRFAAGTDA
jgi:YHS domain-containing protein